jgi:4-amino-4-deoxy-L-arabinose transferase-like glycosyltransferase
MTTAHSELETIDRHLSVLQNRHKWIDLNAVVLLLLIESIVITWMAYDHSVPCWDTAGHRISSIMVYELLHHAHCRSVDWYQHLFAVSPLYPPLFYIISGSLKIVLGKLGRTDEIVNLVFVAIQFLSVYQAAYLTSSNRVAASIAGVLVFLYPITFWAAHSILLDCAANAMVALALCTFLWWSSGPTLLRSLLLGLVFGLTMLAKNNTVAFLLGPVLLDVLFALRDRNQQRFKQLALSLVVCVLVVAPWLLMAGPRMLDFVRSIQQQNFGAHDRFVEFFNHFKDFALVDMRGFIFSPLPCFCFLIALLNAFRALTRKKSYLIASILVGVLVCCSFRWVHQARYFAPITIGAAILTAEMFSGWWLSGKVMLRANCVILTVLMVLHFVCMNFVPYPIQPPGWLNELLLSKELVFNYRSPREVRGVMGISFYPIPEADWGMEWSLSTIRKATNDQITTLVVLPNSDQCGESTLRYLSLTKNYRITLKNCRTYSVAGDFVSFAPSQVLNAADWYILKNGDQGREFADQASLNAYNQCCQFIRTSGKFLRVGSKQLPDGSTLELYCKRSRQDRGASI